MPTDPESKRSTPPRHGDTDASAVNLAEINRLQIQRDSLRHAINELLEHVWVDYHNGVALSTETVKLCEAIDSSLKDGTL